MYTSIRIITAGLSVFILGGCVLPVDKTLSPSKDTNWVNFEVKNPSQYTKPFPLEVRYISHKCQKKRVSGFDGSVISEPSYNVINIPMQQSGDTWTAKVAMTGGGFCRWTLSAISLGIKYIDATHIGEGLIPGAAVGAKIAFDFDASSNGQYSIVNGDLTIRPKYYPYIMEWGMNKNLKELSLLGEESFLSYRVIDAKKILFEPALDERKIVRFVEPEKKIKGVHSRIIYPDGGVVSDGTIFPDFDKVDKMKY